MKKVVKKLFNPKNEVIIFGIFFIILSLLYLIILKKFGNFLSYFLYLLMSYFLVITCIEIYKIVKSKINLFIDNNNYLKKYKDDYKLKYKISLLISLLFNIFYAVFKLITDIVLNSVWFISFALYYILLIILRVNLIKKEFNYKKKL